MHRQNAKAGGAGRPKKNMTWDCIIRNRSTHILSKPEPFIISLVPFYFLARIPLSNTTFFFVEHSLDSPGKETLLYLVESKRPVHVLQRCEARNGRHSMRSCVLAAAYGITVVCIRADANTWFAPNKQHRRSATCEGADGAEWSSVDQIPTASPEAMTTTCNAAVGMCRRQDGPFDLSSNGRVPGLIDSVFGCNGVVVYPYLWGLGWTFDESECSYGEDEMSASTWIVATSMNSGTPDLMGSYRFIDAVRMECLTDGNDPLVKIVRTMSNNCSADALTKLVADMGAKMIGSVLLLRSVATKARSLRCWPAPPRFCLVNG